MAKLASADGWGTSTGLDIMFLPCALATRPWGRGRSRRHCRQDLVGRFFAFLIKLPRGSTERPDPSFVDGQRVPIPAHLVDLSIGPAESSGHASHPPREDRSRTEVP